MYLVGESDEEGAALTGSGCGPHPPAMLLHHEFHNGEADAGAFVLAGTVEPLEETEDFVGLAGIEADAVVADPENVLRRGLLPSNGDSRRSRVWRELQRVVQEIRDGLAHADRFAVEI